MLSNRSIRCVGALAIGLAATGAMALAARAGGGGGGHGHGGGGFHVAVAAGSAGGRPAGLRVAGIAAERDSLDVGTSATSTGAVYGDSTAATGATLCYDDATAGTAGCAPAIELRRLKNSAEA